MILAEAFIDSSNELARAFSFSFCIRVRTSSLETDWFAVEVRLHSITSDFWALPSAVILVSIKLSPASNLANHKASLFGMSLGGRDIIESVALFRFCERP